MNKKHFILLVFAIICIKNTNAQSTKVYPDAGMWMTYSLDVALNKKWALLFTQEARFRENYSRINLFYTNLGIEYKINDHFKTNLVYRWIDKVTDENSFSFRHRLMWDVTGKVPFKEKWTFAYRHRLQVEFRDIMTSEYGQIPEWYSRHKGDIGYKINEKLSAGFSTEMRYQIYDRRRESSQGQWHRIRYQAGIDYKINNNSKLGLYYIMQREFNVSQPNRTYITGIEFAQKIKW